MRAISLPKVLRNEFFAALFPEQLDAIRAFQRVRRGVPPEYDGRLLATARMKLSRDLDAGDAVSPAEGRTIRGVGGRKPPRDIHIRERPCLRGGL